MVTAHLNVLLASFALTLARVLTPIHAIPYALQVHLLKLFDNVKEFGFARGNKAVTSLVSSEGENFSLLEASPVGGEYKETKC